ncbi:MAG: GNAT family N-acetyltransferase [Deltaproteobacteria bacterium]|nr:GNAT family N-acetyltransferase [Deltaproteobacteria bacterium]
MSSDFVIKTMNREEIDLAMEWAAREGWNPGLHDADCFYQTDPQGFLIGTINSTPIGCISAVSYHHVFGFIGFYIVAPEYRGKGYGIRLWDAAMNRLDNQNVGLDGVLEQQENYKKSGFRLAYGNSRFESLSVKTVSPDRAELRAIQEIPFHKIQEYDRQCFPAERTAFLRAWLRMPEAHGVGVVEKGELQGYGLIRKCRRGYKIGPLFAEDPGTAEAIFLDLSSRAEEKEVVYLDIPERNPAALVLAGKYGMQKVFSTARMYTGKEPEIPLSKVFGVTTFELG